MSITTGDFTPVCTTEFIAFGVKANAERLSKELKPNGYATYIV